MRSPKIFETFVTVENELPNNASGISNDTIERSKLGVSSFVVGSSDLMTRSWDEPVNVWSS